MPEPGPERLVVGLVRGLQGLRGALRIEPLTDEPTRFARGNVLHPEGDPAALTIEWSRRDGPGVLVRFAERPTRESADALRGRYLEVVVAPDALPAGTWYWHQIVGLPVSTVGGEALGTVTDVLRAGGSEVYVVGGGPRGEILVPAVGTVVRELDPSAGRLVVDEVALDLGPVRGRRPRGRRTTRALRGAVPPDTTT